MRSDELTYIFFSILRQQSSCTPPVRLTDLKSGDVASSATEQGHDTAAPFVESVIIKPSQTEEEKLALQTE